MDLDTRRDDRSGNAIDLVISNKGHVTVQCNSSASGLWVIFGERAPDAGSY
jgi:hypothetical protein